MKATEDRSPSAVFPVRMPSGTHKYLAAVVLRLGRGFSISALLNQIVPKYVDTYAGLVGKPELDLLAQRAIARFEHNAPMDFDHRMPLSVAELMREKIPGMDDRDQFNRTLDQLVLLAAYDFRENGPLKGREF